MKKRNRNREEAGIVQREHVEKREGGRGLRGKTAVQMSRVTQLWVMLLDYVPANAC